MDAAWEKQAADMVMLDMRGVCTFTEYFVICSGETSRQIEAICDEVERVLGEERVVPRRREGTGSGWILMDFGDLIVHVFTPTDREYYQLERLWAKATPLIRIQ